MGVYIDIEMPKCCADCVFFVQLAGTDVTECIMAEGRIGQWCPLEETDRKTEPTGYNLSPVGKDINVRSKDEPKLSEIPTSKCHYEPKADGILFKGNLKEGDYKLIKTTNGWVLEGNDIAYYGEPQTSKLIDAYTKGWTDGADAVKAMPQTDCPWK